MTNKHGQLNNTSNSANNNLSGVCCAAIAAAMGRWQRKVLDSARDIK